MTPSPALPLPVRRFAMACGEGKGDQPHKRLQSQCVGILPLKIKPALPARQV